jgi:hypothetical protein
MGLLSPQHVPSVTGRGSAIDSIKCDFALVYDGEIYSGGLHSILSNRSRV